MLFHIICVGKLKDKFFSSRIENYCKKIAFDGKIVITELKDSTKEKENEKIIEILEKEKGFVLSMSEEGKHYSSREFAQLIDKAQQKVIFIIGGPFGLTDDVKKRCDGVMSLSKMTFTHEMARLFLTEQIYRAVSIIKNRKYHND